MDVRVGDKLQMKKPHPCGTNVFEVLRIGADFKSAAPAAAEKSWCPATSVKRTFARSCAKVPAASSSVSQTVSFYYLSERKLCYV